MIDFRTQKRNTNTIGGVVEHMGYTTPLLFGSYAQNNYLSIPAVYAALDLISSSIAVMPLQVRQKGDNKSTVIEDHPILRLFDEMIQSKYILFRSIVFDTLWWGNSYIYIKRDGKGVPTKLIYLQHGDVSVDYNKTKGTIIYQIANHLDVPQTAKPENMLHFFKNTRDGVTGIGLLAYASQAFKLADNLNSAADDFFSSGCNVTGILKFAGIVPDKSKKEIREQWSQIHAPGATGSGLVVIGGDADYIPVSQDPSKSQMLESREFGIAEIARFFGISPLLLQDLTNGSGAIEEIALQFVKYTLTPLVSLIEHEMNRKLFPGISSTWLDLDETALLAADKQSLANYLSTLTKNGIISTNEARAQLDLNPVDGGDALLIPYTDLGMNTINPDSNTNNDLNGVSEPESEPETKTRKKTRKKTTK